MGRRKTTEEFIASAKKLYGDRYDYSKVEYHGCEKKVCIVCPEHGEWWVSPHNFLNGHKCPTCSGRQRITRDVFIYRSREIHENRYDYSKVEYKGLNTPVCIICPVHGEFWQKPSGHLNGNGCQQCFSSPKSNTDEFINKAKSVYGEKYDYSKVVYNGNKEKVCITCPEHGEWWVTPNNFLRGSRCPKCFGTPKHTNQEFISKAEIVHGSKYDYSNIEYDGLQKKVTIICPIHGEFMQKADIHLRGGGCPKCSGTERITKGRFLTDSLKNHAIEYDYSKISFRTPMDKVCIICPEHGEFWQTARYHMYGGNCPKCVGGVKLTTADFVEKAMAVHGNKYDYSRVRYKNYSSKVCIICPEHGEFWQTPNNHLFGAGCPACPQSNMEGEMRQFLINHNIEFEQEKSFDWLKYKRKMFLDFYLPKYNVAIECQGLQHFKAVDLFGGKKFFDETLERDQAKFELCKNHGINLLYYSRASIAFPYHVYENLNELLDEILTSCNSIEE